MTQTHVSMEVADVACTAVERCNHHMTEPLSPGGAEKGYSDMESLRSENQRLRLRLETNLTLLQQMSASPTLSQKLPFRYSDLEKAEVLISQEEPSWWLWVSEEMVSTNAEEKSGIDDENYIVVSEDVVIDGVANFMARCIVAKPKALNLTPQELQSALTKALGGLTKVEKMRNIWHAGKMLYTMATWGLTLASFYQGRAILRLAAVGFIIPANWP